VIPHRRANDVGNILDLVSSDPDTLEAYAAPTEAVFALIWLVPSTAYLIMSARAFAAQMHADLKSVFDGLALPHIVEISEGQSAAVVELVPVKGAQSGVRDLLTHCEHRLIDKRVLLSGVITRYIISISLVTAESARPPRPPGNWSQTAVLVSPFLGKRVMTQEYHQPASILFILHIYFIDSVTLQFLFLHYTS
jgi:hypothetical protein